MPLGAPQNGVVGVGVGVEEEVVVGGTVTVCSPKSKEGVSSSTGELFFWASSFSVSLV